MKYIILFIYLFIFKKFLTFLFFLFKKRINDFYAVLVKMKQLSIIIQFIINIPFNY